MRDDQSSKLRCHHNAMYANDWSRYCENCIDQLSVVRNVTRYGQIDIDAIEAAGEQYPCMQPWKKGNDE